MINAQDMEVRIGQRLLVSRTNLRIDKGMRIGLVGRNGAGKTTTMRLIAALVALGKHRSSGSLSEEEAQDLIGNIDFQGKVTSSGSVGYLSQDPAVGVKQKDGISRIMAVRNLDRTLRAIEKAQEKMSTTSGETQAKAIERYARLDEEFTRLGGYAARSEAMQIAHNLGLDQAALTQPLATLSGGQRRRVELARVLFSQPDVLLLDEPTNHLDHDSIIWLRDFLRTYAGGFVMVTHSTALLKDTVNQVWYLDASRAVIDQYKLGWDAYLKQRAQDEARRRRERQNALAKAQALREQGEKMRAKATKAVAAQQMLRRAEELVKEAGSETQAEKVARLRFPTPLSCGKVPLNARGLAKSYGSLEVFSGLDLSIDRGSKVVVLGENGAGKTTLLRLLNGIEELDAGEVVPGHGLKLGYYAQEHETLDPARTVYENMTAAAPDLDETHVRNILGQFLFSGEDAFKPASVLSGGEKTRLALATLVVSGANVLLLDEPTNNLDPASREEILHALDQYEGAVVLVTHDPGAVQALNPQRVLLLPDGDEDLWSDDYLDLVELT